MPNRYIRESAIESEPVNSLSWAAEVFYRRLLNRVDDFGRFSANPSMLRAMLFPLQISKVSEGDVSKYLSECCKAGLVFIYRSEGKSLLVVNKWEKGRAKHSRYAEPPADICERMKTFVYGCKHKSTNAPDSDSDTDDDTDTDAGANAGASPTSDKDWLESLKVDPAYVGIDVAIEHAKATRWCETNRKQLSRRRFVNWLNRAERPMGGAKPQSEFANAW
jgi:hypothetical protein